MRKEKWFLGVLIFLLLVLIILAPGLGWRVSRFLAGQEQGSENEFGRLVSENQILRSELIKLQDIRDRLPKHLIESVPAVVYSRYPFNLKNELLINVGQDQGIQAGHAVVFGELKEGDTEAPRGILVGRVDKVFKETSVVVTVFDERWRLSVRIGEKGVEALLKGGAKPKLSLISKEAAIEDRDLVYNADSNFPDSLPIGEAVNVGLSADHLFKEADLGLGYDLSHIRTFMVLKK